MSAQHEASSNAMDKGKGKGKGKATGMDEDITMGEDDDSEEDEEEADDVSPIVRRLAQANSRRPRVSMPGHGD
jgi:hypothetical protein